MTTTDRENSSSISFRQLLMFESVARLHSVQRAAEECHLSQPAVSQAFAKLERQVGANLLSRNRNGSYLSEQGDVFRLRVARMLSAFKKALYELDGGANAPKHHTVLARISRSHVRVLIAVLDDGCLASAATRLGLSEGTLKRATVDVEAVLGHPLFQRSTAGVTLTAAGADFARCLKLGLHEIAAGVQEMAALRGDKAMEITVGAMFFGGSMLLASALTDFTANHPEFHVRVVNDTAAMLRGKLKAGDFDMMIGLLHGEEPCLVKEALMDTPFRVVARHDHPILRQGRIGLQQLAEYSWVVTSPGSCRRAAMDRLFEGRHFPHAPIVTCSAQLTRQFLMDSDCLTLMTTFELRHQREFLAPVAFDAVPSAPPLGVLLRAGWLPTALHNRFLMAIRAQAAKTAPDEALRHAS
jgi:LysR family transcriptional regulator of gallate degradation